jgi:uncharacterized phage-associated protein
MESFNEQKFRELLLYVARRCEHHAFFSSTTLNKILFYADFTAYWKLGHPITGADYDGWQFGPVPRQRAEVQGRLETRGEAALAKRVGQERLIALREPDLGAFSAEEIAIVDEVIDRLAHHSAEEVSDMSHGFLGWKAAWRKYELTGQRAIIPYSAAFVDNPRLDEFDHARGLALAEKYGWAV